MYDRILAYMEASRPEEAIQECQKILAENPNDCVALAYKSYCETRLGNFKESLRSAQAAVAAEPDFYFGYNALAAAYLALNKHKDAERAASTAVSLNLENTVGWHYLATSQHNQGNLTSALKTVEEGLANDPDDADLASFRAHLLGRLGRTDEAHSVIAKGLQDAPDEADFHEARGITELRAGRHKEAALAFQEALRLNPNDAGAANGLKEALRHRILPYKIMANAVSLVERLPGNAQWVFWLGLYVLFRIGRSVAQDNPQLMPVFIPFAILYFLLFIFTWLGETLANITLFFHPLGRLALTRIEKTESGGVVICLAAIIVSAFAGVLMGGSMAVISMTVCAFLILLIGLSSHLRSQPKIRLFLARLWTAIAIVLALLSLIPTPQ